MRPPCYHQEPKEAHDCIFPQPRQCEPLLRLERPMWAYLEVFLATKHELQRCSPKKNIDEITRHYSIKKTCVCINRLSTSLHLCICVPTPFCSGNVPHSSSCLSWHPGSCKEENDLQPVSLFYHGPDGCIYLVPHVWTPSIGISQGKNIYIYYKHRRTQIHWDVPWNLWTVAKCLGMSWNLYKSSPWQGTQGTWYYLIPSPHDVPILSSTIC